MEAKRLLKIASELKELSFCAWRTGVPLDDCLQEKIDILFEDCRRAVKVGRGSLTIALAGKFSSGKSQFINSLVGRDIAPVASDRTTCCRTIFTGDEHIHELRIVEAGTRDELSLSEYKSRASKRAAHENVYTVYLPDAAWKDINMVDTPGFDPPEGGDEKGDATTDSKISREAVKTADVVFFLFDMNQGSIMGDSMEYLKEISKENHYIYIIANKADQKPPTSREVILDTVAGNCHENGIEYKGILPYCALMEHSKEIVDTKKDLARRAKLALAGETRQKVLAAIRKLLARKVGIMEARRKGNIDAILPQLKETAYITLKSLCEAIRRKTDGFSNDDSIDKEGLTGNIVSTLASRALEYTQQRSGRFIRWHALKSKGIFVDDWAIYLDRPGGAYDLEPADRKDLRNAIKTALEDQTPVFAGLEDDLVCLFKKCSDMVIDEFRIKAETTDNYETVEAKDDFFCRAAVSNPFCERCDYESERSGCERKIHVQLCNRFPGRFIELCRPLVSAVISDSWNKHVEMLSNEFNRNIEPLQRLMATFRKRLDNVECENTATPQGASGKRNRMCKSQIDEARSSVFGLLSWYGLWRNTEGDKK